MLEHRHAACRRSGPSRLKLLQPSVQAPVHLVCARCSFTDAEGRRWDHQSVCSWPSAPEAFHGKPSPRPHKRDTASKFWDRFRASQIELLRTARTRRRWRIVAGEEQTGDERPAVSGKKTAKAELIGAGSGI